MSELIVIGFKNDTQRAAAVLGELRERDQAWTATLHGAIAMYRDREGKLIVDESYEATKGNDAIKFGFVGSLVGVALAALALPLTGGLSGAVMAGAFIGGGFAGSVFGARHSEESEWWKSELGIPAAFLDQVRALVQQNDSAIFVLSRTAEHDLEAKFRPLGGTVLHATLTPEQTAKLHARLS